jgi:hypothetical protein
MNESEACFYIVLASFAVTLLLLHLVLPRTGLGAGAAARRLLDDTHGAVDVPTEKGWVPDGSLHTPQQN